MPILVPLLVVAVWAVVFAAFCRPMSRLWREPVLRHPVAIIESDDWGPGPPDHAAALEQVCAVLARHRDATGRAAVMTIGVILGAPDKAAIAASGYTRYARKTLLDVEFDAMRECLRAGREHGVLALQLHGLEHLWPPALLSAAQRDGAARRWLAAGDEVDTQALPSHLQTRWADASVLPSRLPPEVEVRAAVSEEVAVFSGCFGAAPEVVVPPTFVWHASVERAWAAQGVRALVTPGCRLTGRDADGRPAMSDCDFLNGERAAGGMVCLVRDIYFEPALGHTVDRAVRDAVARFRLGRPALFETHRMNFVEDAATRQGSLDACERLLDGLREVLPGTRYMSSSELADAYRAGRGDLFDVRLAARLRTWLARAGRYGRLRKVAWATGLVVPAALLYLVADRVCGEQRCQGGLHPNRTGCAK